MGVYYEWRKTILICGSDARGDTNRISLKNIIYLSLLYFLSMNISDASKSGNAG